MSEQVQRDSALLVHLVLQLEDGTQAESTRASGKPMLFRLGDGSLSTTLEQHLYGLKTGDKTRFTLQPKDAFGERNPDLLQFFLPRDFADTGMPKVGTIMLFSAMDGSELPGIVRDVTGESVTVDFNHPLAGHPVIFDVEVLEINPQSGVVDANPVG